MYKNLTRSYILLKIASFNVAGTNLHTHICSTRNMRA